MTELHIKGVKAMLNFISKICEGITIKEGFNNTLTILNNNEMICNINFSERRKIKSITIPIKADEIRIFCDYIDYIDTEEALGAYLINEEPGERDILAGTIPLNPKNPEEKRNSILLNL